MGYPDKDARRMHVPGSPLDGTITLTAVAETDISLHDATKAFGKIVAEKQVGKRLYWGQSVQDAYVFPDSSMEHPHTLPYSRVERFCAVMYTDKDRAEQRAAEQREIVDALRQYRQADVELELATSLSRGDESFVGVMGAALRVPGVTDEERNSFHCRVEIIPNTDDSPTSNEAVEFDEVAGTFAAAYNRALLKHLVAEKKTSGSQNDR
jgi:hypothetical protein